MIKSLKRLENSLKSPSHRSKHIQLRNDKEKGINQNLVTNKTPSKSYNLLDIALKTRALFKVGNCY